MTDTSNNPLVIAAQAGDTASFTALVDKNYAMVHGLVYSKIGDWTVAEDVTQDVFLVVWSNLSKLKHPEAFLVWLRQIARNASVNWVRKEQYRRALMNRREQQERLSSVVEEDPSGATARKECLEQIEEALRSLSPKLREALVLYYIEGNTAREAAESLGINVDTMKKRLRLGKKKMQRYYERKRMDDLDPLLPHKPKHRIERIVSGVAMGPVMPELGATMATPGPFMWLSDLWNGASFSSAKGALAHSGAGAWATAKTVAVVATIGAIGVGAGAVLVFPPSDVLDEEAAPVAASAEAFLEEDGYIAVAELPIRDGSEPVTSERTLRVTRDVGGLLQGDRVIEIRGLRLSASIFENPRATLQGLPGEKIPVTVERNLSDGTGTKRLELEFEIPYLTDRFGTQSAN